MTRLLGWCPGPQRAHPTHGDLGQAILRHIMAGARCYPGHREALYPKEVDLAGGHPGPGPSVPQAKPQEEGKPTSGAGFDWMPILRCVLHAGAPRGCPRQEGREGPRWRRRLGWGGPRLPRFPCRQGGETPGQHTCGVLRPGHRAGARGLVLTRPLPL